jgi:hydroxyacyl-ACP dehydratase HTD2-like protein with hotdog domain
VVSKIADIRESAGRLGAMVFITVETSYTNHYNQLCALQRSTVIRY